MSLLPGAVLLAVAILSVAPASAQWPTRPIRIVTSEPGGGNDFAARLIVQGIGANLGQPFVVENRGGAGGAIAADLVAKAAPDGHTLLFYASGIWLIPFLRSNVPYDPVRDLAPITLAVKSPSIVVVNAALPVKSIKELIALARARPGELNYGSGTAGSTHLAAELFKSMTGVRIERISYRANAPALNDLLAGQVQLMFATAGTVAPHLKSGRLRALAVTSAEPSALAPGLPTVAATVPGYEVIQMYAMFAPAKTPEPVVRRLHQEVVRALNLPDIREKLFASGVEVVGSSSAELGAAMKTDMARMGKVIREAGIRED
jgi:tripartite-type tricarboxylate transporter receptor subunit TctC